MKTSYRWPFIALTIATTILTSECKTPAKKNDAGLRTVRGSDVDAGDPSLYVLDERKYDGQDLRTLTVLRLDCGGDDRYLRGSIEELKASCLEVNALSLHDLLEVMYVPYFWTINETRTVTTEQKEFLVYLVKALRPFPSRLLPLNVKIPDVASSGINIASENPHYSELFRNYLTKLADYIDYRGERLTAAPQLTQNIALTSAPNNAWTEQFFKIENRNLDALSQINLSATGTCPVSLVSVRLEDQNSQWITLRKAGGGDRDGYYTRYRLEVPKSDAKYKFVRLLWRTLSDQNISCQMNFASSTGWQNDALPPSGPAPNPGTQLTRAQKFQQISFTFGMIGHRLHHLLWHSIRNAWNRPGTSNNDRQLMAQVVPGENWQPPRPLVYRPDGRVDVIATEQASPGAGEDFFHMHREMVKLAQTILTNDFIVVPSLDVLFRERERMINEELVQRIPVRTRREFDEQMNELRSLEANLDRMDLSRMSLGQLGTELEWTLHNGLHDRFSRPRSEIMLVNAANPWTMKDFLSPQHPWNQSSYQHLGDPYASASNPIFWLIHSYVDQWIDRWLKANGYNEISDNCAGRSGCYKWLQTVNGQPWDGGSGVEHAHQMQVSSLPPELAKSLLDMGTFITR